MSRLETRERRPSPSRLIEALRDTGYSFETAIADLIDNSIAALATHIEIHAYLDDKDDPVIYLLDNGVGMNAKELDDAMAYGSLEREEKRSLGKFGMGLKTASTSQAKSLTVITKQGKSIESATWDIDHVVDKDEWELIWGSEEQDNFEKMISELPDNNLELYPNKFENGNYLCSHCEFGNGEENSREEVVNHINKKHKVNSNSGTAVLWKKVDRLGLKTEVHWEKMIKNLKSHLEMVFERYLDPMNNNVRTVNINLNDGKLSGWDPFCKNFKGKTTKIKSTPFSIADLQNNIISDFTLTAYSVPSKSELNKKEQEITKMNNAMKWQGIYVYRDNRLLVAADWFRFRTKEAHLNQLRIELNFDYRLDEDFQLDFKKTRIVFNPAIRKKIRKDWLPLITREADRIYRERSTNIGDKVVHGDSDNIIDGVNITGIELASTENTIEGEESEVRLRNSQGEHTVVMQVSNSDAGKFVQPVDNINGNMVYQPVLIEGNQGVQINTSHDFYKKVYLPNKEIRGVTLGLDGLFWSLSLAEMKAIPATEHARWFSDMRWELTRILQQYANELPQNNLDE